MNAEPKVEIATKDQIAGLAEKLGQMHQRTVAVAAPLKARYAELRDEMKMLEQEIRALDEEWGPPK
jgi:hypothetical protein